MMMLDELKTVYEPHLDNQPYAEDDGLWKHYKEDMYGSGDGSLIRSDIRNNGFMEIGDYGSRDSLDDEI